jgi:hypothetical protein
MSYIMAEYYCECCGLITKDKTKFDRHLKTKKHEKLSQNYPKLSFLLPEITPNLLEKGDYQHTCKYCEKRFKFASGLSRHIKYTCKKNKDEDFKELARLMNEQNQKKDEQIEMILKQNEKLQKQIDKLSNKLKIQNINHGTINNSNNINIKLLNFSETDYSHLSKKDYIKCIKDCNHCVKTLIQKVHFNKTKPENMNIYISNIKGEYAMIYSDNKWQITNKKEQIDDLYEYNEVVLENWYKQYKDEYPHIIESFQRYLKNKDEAEDFMVNRVKEQILLLLYNNRNILQESQLE